MLTVFYDSYQVLTKVYSDGAFISQALNTVAIEPLKRKEITKICYGVLDKDIELSYYISLLTNKNPKLAIRVLLKIAMYCIKYLEKKPFAVVNNIVELTKKLGKGANTGFVNATLRNFLKSKLEVSGSESYCLSVKYNYPEFAVDLLLKTYGIETACEIMGYDKSHTYVRFDSATDGKKYLTDNGYDYSLTPFDGLFDVKNISINQDFYNGLFTFQSIGSVAICDVFTGGDKLLDACSAPGGKSVLLSQKYNNVISCELHEHRVELIRSYVARMKRENVTAIVKDSTKFCKEFESNFDAVLCDVPCSGYGTVKNNPDLKLKKEISNILSLNKIQLSILNNCAKYLKIGGEIVYSTCSIFSQENDDIVEKFLFENKNFEVCKVASKLSALETKYGLQFLPHLSGGAGFYLCKMRRTK